MSMIANVRERVAGDERHEHGDEDDRHGLTHLRGGVPDQDHDARQDHRSDEDGPQRSFFRVTVVRARHLVAQP